MSDPSDPLDATDDLPPVKPPTGGFILQLFVVPALIVAALILVVGLFGMLADSATEPEQYVQQLLHENAQRRWRAAHGLANMLTADSRKPLHFGKLSQDRQLAASLADTLQRILEGRTQVGASNSEEDTLLRAYLATALGMFNEPVGVPALLQAMRDDQTEVRLRAMESIAMLADDPQNSNQPRDLGHGGVVPALSAMVDDQEPVIRKMCAYAMGVVGDARFVGSPPERPGPLLRLAGDADADVSYNAATALARMGRAESIAMLDRMLLAAPSDAALLHHEKAGERDYKVSAILVAALESIKVLAAKNPDADLSPLAPNVSRLKNAEPEWMRGTGFKHVRVLAAEVLRLTGR